MTIEYVITLGLEVGKTAHYGCALTPDGTRVCAKELPQDEAALRKVIIDLQNHGVVLVVVDLPNSIGALPMAVARGCGADVTDLAELVMRKAADLCPGGGRRRTRGTRSSSPTPPGPCRTLS